MTEEQKQRNFRLQVLRNQQTIMQALDAVLNYGHGIVRHAEERQAITKRLEETERGIHGGYYGA